MTSVGQKEEMHVTTLDVEGRSFNVSIEVENDGIDHVGHLWFTDEASRSARSNSSTSTTARSPVTRQRTC